MLKGVLPQLNSINAYIQSILPAELQDLTWEIYLLNTEKNVFEILKLVQIIFAQLEESLPKGVKYQYQRSCDLLKKYFKSRPQLEIDHEDRDKRTHTPQYDQVQHYLDNKPEIDINNDQRSELFKFLSINDQKEKDNAILLDSIPRYNFDYTYQPKSTHHNKTISNKSKAPLSEFSKVIIQKCESQTIQNLSSQVNIFKFTEEAAVQTENQNIENIQKNDAATSMANLPHSETVSKLKKQKSIGQGKKQTENEGKKKKKKKSIKEDENKNISQSKSNQIISQNEVNSEQKRIARASAMLSDLKTIKDLSNFEQSKQEKAKKKRQSKRESSNSILSNKKEIKSIFSKNQQKRLSKDVKETKDNKIFNESKFNKQRKNFSNQYPSTILQTKQELTNSYVNADIFTENNNIKQNQISQNTQQPNCNNSRVVIDIPNNKIKMTEESTTKQQELPNVCNINENIERVKISSNKEEVKQYQSLGDKAYANTIGHPFYRKTSNNQKSEDKNNNQSLPKIQQKNIKAKYESIEHRKKKKTYENSPYAKPSIQLLTNPKIFKNPSLNHRSFHLNPLQAKFGLSPTHFNKTQKTQKSQQDLEGSFKNCNSFPKFETNPANYVSQAQRQVMLQEQHNKIVKFIEENMVNKQAKDFQWARVMKNIKSYEHLHLNLCGQNCIHLNKFYQFLKKKNLSIYANRKELLVHKKNIEINTH